MSNLSLIYDLVNKFHWINRIFWLKGFLFITLLGFFLHKQVTAYSGSAITDHARKIVQEHIMCIHKDKQT